MKAKAPQGQAPRDKQRGSSTGGQRPGLVVIGASAGGVQALQTLVSELPAAFPAAILIVLHIGSHPSIMPALLSARGPLKAQHATDGEPIVAGHIRLAPPDHHLLVEGQHLRLSRGPKEHHTRPAIDPLFRSAAMTVGPGVVGVVLTGRLDDGTAGLQAIKAYGGIAVVQDPGDAAESSMPASALKYVHVDHCVPLALMAGLLTSLAMEHLEAIALPSPFVCPDCKGGLWEIRASQPQRYRCHTGHAFTLRTLRHAQSEATDEALWGALRALQEKEILIRTEQTRHRAEGDERAARQLDAEVEQLTEQANLLRQLLERMPGP
ncbi:chemotaxis protein CheB [Piscinibacter sp. XHJ-5]|uniref:chemotaxis protein CheB n=1 Tax=Piscinibacter sp. XHJ-5 TaxID=3037797 RepID=UPI0024534E26|nr:chemotaxis protein CheB [Piscinibacter sp. XHJ-5]